MSVVVRERSSGRLQLFCKGADAAILPRLSRAFSESVEGQRIVADSKAAIDQYAMDGLRTLCVAVKPLEEEAFEEWLDVYEEAEKVAVDADDEMLGEAASFMEDNLELLGVTAIEDRLQENVEETISSLRRAGIQVWVLTGDKLETALNIARSCGLFGNDASTHQIDGLEDLRAVDAAVPYNLVLNPSAIDHLRQGQAEMVECVANCVAVLCYRMTPAGKSDVVKAVKKRLKGKTLAIGDGANDVPMIQTADVGVGITGLEGMQAAMASDFAVARFFYLRKLLLVHGHWSYYRIASAFLYFLYKNASWVFVVFWYQFFNDFSANTPLDPLFSMLYSIPKPFFSLQPVFHGIFDQDADEFVLGGHPELYKQGRRNKLYRNRDFFLNMADALWQSAVIFFIAYGVYNETASDYWAFSFQLCSGIYVVNSGHLLLITGSWTMPLMWMNIVFTVLYFGINFLYALFVSPRLEVGANPPVGTYIASMTDHNFWYVLLLTTVVALLPRTIAILMTNTIQPSDVFLEQEKRKAEIQQKMPPTVICGRPINFLRI
ncbi:hypothetical protein QR680_013121 [Steinernema hermaphroditum]|uniref:Phospholipid-transporting ATPase n=1 Tax=Steinernema hermaphroditum TaxID=289476 RepID=A0AA39I623_9BILA|nr:hypothetical protein QR680_013121 [Steinernema hermaphroditum]